MKIGLKLKKFSMFTSQFYVYSICKAFIVEWDYILSHALILGASHDTWCPHSCMTTQKVPYLAHLCPQILAGVLLHITLEPL